MIETVRCIIENSEGKVLLLQKASDSIAAGLYEFPGGKIDSFTGNSSTRVEQLMAVINEVHEETGIDISELTPQKLDEFVYEYTINDSIVQRTVHLYFVRLHHSEVEIQLNSVVDDKGQSEDRHSGFEWVSKNELQNWSTQGKLSGNSQRFEKVV